MKTSNELYDVYRELIRDAKESIKDILSKQHNQRIEVDMNIVGEYVGGAYKENVIAIQLKDGQLILIGNNMLINRHIMGCEWLYILECVECGLEE